MIRRKPQNKLRVLVRARATQISYFKSWMHNSAVGQFAIAMLGSTVLQYWPNIVCNTVWTQRAIMYTMLWKEIYRLVTIHFPWSRQKRFFCFFSESAIPWHQRDRWVELSWQNLRWSKLTFVLTQITFGKEVKFNLTESQLVPSQIQSHEHPDFN